MLTPQHNGSLQCGVIVGRFNLQLHSRKFKCSSTAFVSICQAALTQVCSHQHLPTPHRSLCKTCISQSIEASSQIHCLKRCAFMASMKMNKDYSRSRRTCRVMLGNQLSALLGCMPTPLLQHKSSLTYCLDPAADLIQFQIRLVDYSRRPACLVFFLLLFLFLLLLPFDNLQVFNMKYGIPQYLYDFVLL